MVPINFVWNAFIEPDRSVKCDYVWDRRREHDTELQPREQITWADLIEPSTFLTPIC